MRKAIPALLAAAAAGAAPQQAPAPRPPYIGYVYPAGGRRGSTVEVRIGGENIYGATAAVVTGRGVTVEVVDSRDPRAGLDLLKKKRANRTVLDEIIRLRITIAPDAEPGPRDLCVAAPAGLSNKRTFQVDQLPEVLEDEAGEKRGARTLLPSLPAVANGQILPGDVDAFRFSARKGQRLVAEVSARALIPYIADAVPGWFQAVVSLADLQGRELAYADDFRFNPDPVLFFTVPADGEYVLCIRDSIYRGREDFVYRIRIGELPFITGVFPLGARQGETPAVVRLSGFNLPSETLSVPVHERAPSVRFLATSRGDLVSNRVPFEVGDLPEILEPDPSPEGGKPHPVSPPVVVNGRLRTPGERDVYSFPAKKGRPLVLEVRARRLGSPLDARLAVADSRGVKLAENDDAKDPGEGMLTHHADSYLSFTPPEDGTYVVTLADTQGKGGEDYAYRLRIGPPRPDFELRATPSEVSLPRGGSAALTLHAFRRDGFDGEIRVALEEGTGLTLEGGTIPAGTDKVRATLTATEKASPGTLFPRLVGTATVGGQVLTRPVVPADEAMQAFAYTHLVPARAQVAVVSEEPAPFSVSVQLPKEGYVTLPRGKEVSFPIRVQRRPGFNGPVRIQLVNPPKGITVSRSGALPGMGFGLVRVQASADTEARPLENLIFSADLFLPNPEETPSPAPAPAGKPAEKKTAAGEKPEGDKAAAKNPTPSVPPQAKKAPFRRVTLTLPAVPFRIVGDPPPAPAKPGAAKAGGS